MPGRRDAQHLPLDLPALRAFLAVGEAGSMTMAARRLGLTQSAMSQAVRQLEDMLGTVLFDRSQRPLALTPAGRLLQRDAMRIVDDAQALATLVRQAGSRKVQDLRVGVIDSFAATVGPRLLRSLLGEAVRVAFRSGLASDQAAGLLSRELDLIITSDPLEDLDRLDRHLLLSEPFVLLTPLKWSVAEAQANLKTLAARRALIRFSARSQMGVQVERHLRRCGVNAARFLEMDATDALVAMVAEGLGWAIATPLCVLQVEDRASGVRVSSLPGAPAQRHLYLISRAGEYGDLPARIAVRACSILEEDYLLRLKRVAGRAAGELVVGGTDGKQEGGRH